jgi:hypothetical protein
MRVASTSVPRLMTKQRIERRPVEPLLDPVQKSSTLPIPAHHRVDDEGWDRSRRDIGESSSLG